jgi:hypothetical protein
MALLKRMHLVMGEQLAQVRKGLVRLFSFLFIILLKTELCAFFLDGPTSSIQPRNGLYATSGDYLEYAWRCISQLHNMAWT